MGIGLSGLLQLFLGKVMLGVLLFEIGCGALQGLGGLTVLFFQSAQARQIVPLRLERAAQIFVQSLQAVVQFGNALLAALAFAALFGQFGGCLGKSGDALADLLFQLTGRSSSKGVR